MNGKPCVRCERRVDVWARLCPFCNWMQSETPPPRGERPAAARTQLPREATEWRAPALMLSGIAALLVASFAVGALVHARSTPEPDASEAASSPADATPRANVTLEPVTEPIAGIEQPITTAPAAGPAGGVLPEVQRADVTAASSEQYAQMAKLARSEKLRASRPFADPRTVTALPAWAAGGKEARKPERPRVAMHLRPEPESQPLPAIEVTRDATARLELLVGADGRVLEVNVRKPIPGNTAKLISAVQAWKFKPAMENGVPVAAPFTVDISFNANE